MVWECGMQILSAIFSKRQTHWLYIATLFCTMFLRDPPNMGVGARESGHLNHQNHRKKRATFLPEPEK